MSNIVEFQKALPSFGIKYLGPADGSLNVEFISAMIQLEQAIQSKTGKEVQGKIFSGGQVLMSPSEVINAFISPSSNKPEVEKEKEVKEAPQPPKSLDNIKSFQIFLKEKGLYAGLVDGVSNPELSSAAKKLEAQISHLVPGIPINGAIWNEAKQQFNTSVEDVKQALELISNNQGSSKKVSPEIKQARDRRFATLAKFLITSSNN